ncbi:hypothetical protein FA95DRAFT_1578748 [Auriscalpium vulgare]|uniref:Uncharacterized protein n=1 Tax=Auriscalpium vulgare TaxID=40419 RepID=A0ACB8R108_9AGAM|nr:hypothetical protein FA95DRAFT_1578748 [Auriscalpium vulgare]
MGAMMDAETHGDVLDNNMQLPPTDQRRVQSADKKRAENSAGKEKSGTPGGDPGNGKSGGDEDGAPNVCVCGRCEPLPEVPNAVKVGAAAVVGAAAMPAVTTAGLGIVGFSSTGVVGGSIAAGIQSAIGNVAAGSLFAGCQSIAMGAAFPPLILAIGAGVAAASAYRLLHRDKTDAGQGSGLVHVSTVNAHMYPCVIYMCITAHMPDAPALTLVDGGDLLDWKLVGPARSVLELRFKEPVKARAWVDEWHVDVPEELRQLVVEVVN